MADWSLTAGNVLPTTTTDYVDRAGIAGATIAAGDIVYKDSTTNSYKLAQADVALGVADASAVGMAMNSAASGQPVVVAQGLITIGSGFTAGIQYNLSAAAGKACPVADTVAGTNLNVVAIGCMMSATTFFVAIKNYSVIKA
jgi:hypothetical protein